MFNVRRVGHVIGFCLRKTVTIVSNPLSPILLSIWEQLVTNTRQIYQFESFESKTKYLRQQTATVIRQTRIQRMFQQQRILDRNIFFSLSRIELLSNTCKIRFKSSSERLLPSFQKTTEILYPKDLVPTIMTIYNYRQSILLRSR